jgi:glyoxylase-like metal-dependent hydrolase (beta-lactamase superfamily II)
MESKMLREIAAINNYFEVVRYQDSLLEVICTRDKLDTICGTFYIVNGSLLIDAGFARHTEEIEEVFRQVNIGLDDIATVLYTHIHVDHLGNPLMFPNARFYAHSEAVEKITEDPPGVLNRDYEYQNKQGETIRVWNEVEALVTRIKNGKITIQSMREYAEIEVLKLEDFLENKDPGIVCIDTSGHAIGHYSYRVGKHIILGDCLSTQKTPHSPHQNIGWQRSKELIRLGQKAYIIHPGHQKRPQENI